MRRWSPGSILERFINAAIRLLGPVDGDLPGRKLLTLVHAMVAGGTHIEDADVLRSGRRLWVLSHRVMVPSALGMSLCASRSVMSVHWTRCSQRRVVGPSPSGPHFTLAQRAHPAFLSSGPSGQSFENPNSAHPT